MPLDLTLLTCSFNDNMLTAFMIKRLFECLGYIIPTCVMDNGTTEKCEDSFMRVFNGVDNFRYKIIPQYKYPSQNHCASIDYAIWNCINTKYVLLCDNDIKAYTNISELLELRHHYDAIGEIGYDTVPPNRLFPYLCIFNLERMKLENIHYFDIDRCIVSGNTTNEQVYSKYGNVYDTGCSFLMDIQTHNWNIKQIKISNYALHYKGVSYDGMIGADGIQNKREFIYRDLLSTVE